jgi:hypothetical protein
MAAAGAAVEATVVCAVGATNGVDGAAHAPLSMHTTSCALTQLEAGLNRNEVIPPDPPLSVYPFRYVVAPVSAGDVGAAARRRGMTRVESKCMDRFTASYGIPPAMLM